jgi:hypothetical protein
MITPSQELPEAPEPLPEPVEEQVEAPVPEAPEPVPEPVPEAPEPVEKPVEKTVEKEDGELEEEQVDSEEEDETYTAKQIEELSIADLRKLAESRGIATKDNGKAIPPKALRPIVLRHFGV